MRLSETVRWIFGGLISVITLLVGMAFNTVKADVSDLKETVPIHTRSIAVIETQQLNQDKKLDEIKSDVKWLIQRELEHPHPNGTQRYPAAGRPIQ